MLEIYKLVDPEAGFYCTNHGEDSPAIASCKYCGQCVCGECGDKACTTCKRDKIDPAYPPIWY